MKKKIINTLFFLITIIALERVLKLLEKIIDK
jgi:hypothetical protein